LIKAGATSKQGRSASEQQEAVISGFPEAPQWFRDVFPYSKWEAGINVRLTLYFFTWLVGPIERFIGFTLRSLVSICDGSILPSTGDVAF